MTSRAGDTEKFRDTLHIPVGASCNNHCIFCNEDRRSWHRTNASYSPALVESLLADYRSRVERVNFTSGEPTINPHLIDFVRNAKKMGYRHVSVTTNGRMLAYERFVAELLHAGVTEVIVSVHGHLPKIHDALTRTRGSFVQTNSGLQNLSRALASQRFDCRLTASVTLARNNYLHFGDMVAFLQGFKVSEIVFNVVQPVQKNMEQHFDKVMPRYRDVARVVEFFFKDNEDCFRNNLVNRRISIIDLPLCQSELLRPFSGYGETRIVEDVDLSPEVEHLDAGSRLQRKVFSDNCDDKVKREQCRMCDYNASCNGIYRMYVERLGWDEFLPVVTR